MKTFKELYEACCSACEKRDEMEESDSGLAAKADKSGVSIGTLRKVYKRGVAAWNSGHRPGTTPQQWGMARVNSYITKGKGTYHGADKDLREEEVELDEVSKVSSFIRKVKQRGIRHAVDPKGAAFQRAVDKADAIHQHKNLDVTDPERKKKLAKRVGKMLDVAGSIHARGKVKEEVELDEGKDPFVSNWKNSVSKRIKRASPEHQTKLNAHLQKAKSASDFERIHQKLDKLGVREEVAKDKESGLPKKYVSGLSPSTAKARAAHWKEKAKLSDRDPAAYEPAPGDATAKTKESKHTIKARKMFGEACWTGYKKVGMKKKGDKMVPNCVPANEESQKGKNVVPPTAGTIGSIGGLVREEENENKPLGKVMRAGDGKKKFKVFVKNSKGNVVKVGFGDPNMEIKRDDPERRKNFRARHNCDTATDRTTPRYWSCRQWRASSKVEA